MNQVAGASTVCLIRWRNASREQMLEHLSDLHFQLALVAGLLGDRDIAYDLATDTSRRSIADAEALLRRRPGEPFQPLPPKQEETTP